MNDEGLYTTTTSALEEEAEKEAASSQGVPPSNLISLVHPNGKEIADFPFADKQKYLDNGYTLPSQLTSLVSPDGKSIADYPAELKTKYLANGYSVPDSPTSKLSYDDVQDKDGNYIVKQPGTDNVLHLPLEEALPLLKQGHLQFNDPGFQSAFDKNIGAGFGSDLESSFRKMGAFEKSAGQKIPLLGSLGTVFESALINNTDDMEDKAKSIAQLANQSDLETPEGKMAEKGGYAGTAGVLAASMMAPGLMGENALAGAAGAAVRAAKLPSMIGEAGALVAQGVSRSVPWIADSTFKGDYKLAGEQILIGGGLELFMGGAFGAYNSFKASKAAGAIEKLPGQINSTLESMGAKKPILDQALENKTKLMDALESAGLKKTSNVDGTISALKAVSSGEKMESLSKLDDLTKINTVHLASDLEIAVKGKQLQLPFNAEKPQISEDLASSVKTLTSKLEALGSEAKLSDVAKIASDLTKDFNPIAPSELGIANKDLHEVLMNKIFSVGDAAVDKMSPKLLDQWATEKSIAQGSKTMLDSFAADVIAAKQSGQTVPKINLGYDIGRALIKKIPIVGETAAVILNGGDYVRGVIPSVVKSLTKNVDSSGNAWILKNTSNPNIGSYLALNNWIAGAKTISKAPEVLQNLGAKIPLAFMTPKTPIKDILGDQANGLSKDQQFNKVSDSFAKLASSQQTRDSYIGALTGPFQQNHPELAAELKAHIENKIAVINNVLNSYNKKEPVLFGDNSKQMPSIAQKADIESGLATIQNPYSLIDKFNSNTITNKDVSLVQQVNPAILSAVRESLVKESSKIELTGQQRISMGILLGQPIEQGQKNGLALQATFTPQQNAPAPAPAGKGKKGSGSHLKASSVASYTTAQNISNGRLGHK
jgi:hypothetical protein